MVAGEQLVISYPNIVSSDAKVSIIVQTFNQEKYIAQCLNSLLMQETDFAYEIIISEDDSTDDTKEICKKFADKYPKIIRLFLHDRRNNIKIDGHPTGRYCFLWNLNHAKGNYIALCEGDDYWTDPLKLQKQVDFLENNTDYVLCFHNTYTLRNGQSPKKVNLSIQHPITMSQLIQKNFIHTASILFRNNLVNLNHDVFKKAPMGDYPLFLFLREKGLFKFLPDYMSVYRKHGGGVWTTLSRMENLDKKIKLYRLMLSALENNSHKLEVYKRIESLMHEKINILKQEEDTPSLLEIAALNIDRVSSKILVKKLMNRLKHKIKW